MEILDVGPLELILIFILMFVFMGPREMQKAGKTIGRWLNKLVKSDFWKFMRDMWDAIFHLPTEMMREANFEELQRELELNPELRGQVGFTKSPHKNHKAVHTIENSIKPPEQSLSIPASPPPTVRVKKAPAKPAAKKTAPPKNKKIKQGATRKPKSTKKNRANA